MVNSHFIPQFILRNFCNDNKIQYYDINNKTLESRSTRSVFSEKGYYPDELEKDLCHKIEYQFSIVLNNKILSARNNVTLNADDLWILKKYLIITALRIRDDNMEHNVWYKVLKRDGFITNPDENKELLCGNFYENINKILDCPDRESALEIAISEGGNLNSFTIIKDIIYSYNVFVKTTKAKEHFIMPDRGWANYCGILSMKKINALHDMPIFAFDSVAQMYLQMASPQDYAIFPLSMNFAIIVMSPIFKLFQKGSRYNIKYPPESPTLSKCLGFGNTNIFAPPGNQIIGKMKLYKYEIHQLKKSDVIFLNSLMIKNADSYIGYADFDMVKESLENCNINIKPEGHDE